MTLPVVRSILFMYRCIKNITLFQVVKLRVMNQEKISTPLHAYVDRKNPIPYYVQIIRAIREQIENGNWQPGYKLPGETEFCRMFDVSRMTIRQALRELVYEDLITRIRGKGTFVAEPKIGESLVQKLTGFYQDMTARGYKPITEVLEQVVIPASPKITKHLQLAEGTLVFKLARKRSIENEPIVLVTTYLPYALCEGLEKEDFSNQSLYAALENKCGLFISSGRRTIEAVLANENESQLLDIEKGAPLILLDSISYLEDGTPIEYYHAVHKGDRTRFEVELVRYQEQSAESKSLNQASNLPQSSPFITEENLT